MARRSGGAPKGDLGTKELPAFPRSALKPPAPPRRGRGEALRQLSLALGSLKSANPSSPLRDNVNNNESFKKNNAVGPLLAGQG